MNDNKLRELVKNTNEICFTISTDYINRVIIMAPHPDDEILGCGGVMALFKSKKIEIHVILFTDGEKGGRQKNIRKLRRAEFVGACDVMGVDYMYFMNGSDGFLKYETELLTEKVKNLINKIRPQYIFMPYIFDMSDDHKAVAEMTINAVEHDIPLLMYEVWTPIMYPDYYIDVTKYYEQKQQAIKEYKSQEKRYSIAEKTESINRMRSVLSMHRRSKYMECFRKF